MKVGIERLCFSTSSYYIDLRDLAAERNIDYKKFYLGIGQEKMSVSPPDEDAVTLGANAAINIIDNNNRDTINMVLFATESSVDQSKAAGIYLHNLLNLPSNCRILELKQACYAATGALQIAINMVRAQPQHKILVIGADLARYALNSSGEATQGSGAIAMVISSTPSILTIDLESGFYTEDIMDFWRPNYLEEALFDGKLSIQTYLKTLRKTWTDYRNKNKHDMEDFAAFCYHTPFAKMAEKAQYELFKINEMMSEKRIQYNETLKKSLYYQRIIGNSYTASLYICLLSLLENSEENYSNKRIGLFSYGSGCVGEFFSGIIEPSYKEVLNTKHHKIMLEERQLLTYHEYELFFNYKHTCKDKDNINIPDYQTRPFRYARKENQKRIYAKGL